MPSVFVPGVIPVLPALVGVPALPAGINKIFPIITVLAEAASIFGLTSRGQWGIFGPNGLPLLAVDSVASIEYSRDYRVSDYPQEQGAFESYNKVKVPFQAKIGFLIAQNRFQFLQGIEAQIKSLQFVSVITPEVTYPSANLTHYGYRRTSRNGVTMILVEVWCEEIRVSSATGFSNTQSPNAATPSNNGNTQPTVTATPNATIGAGASATGDATPVLGTSAGSDAVGGAGAAGTGTANVAPGLLNNWNLGPPM